MQALLAVGGTGDINAATVAGQDQAVGIGGLVDDTVNRHYRAD